MDISNLSAETLKALHALIGDAIISDNAAPKGQEQYGVRIYPDWRKQADAFEARMLELGISFEPLDWSIR